MKDLSMTKSLALALIMSLVTFVASAQVSGGGGSAQNGGTVERAARAARAARAMQSSWSISDVRGHARISKK